jgi:hypothetical protein
MRARNACVIATLLACGCATQRAAKHELVPAALVCLDDRQCEAMWSAARRWILNTCRYPIERETANLIETRNTVNNTVPRQVSTALACRVTRTARPEGGSVVAATASCSAVGPTADPCYPPVSEALHEFRRSLERVAARF